MALSLAETAVPLRDPGATRPLRIGLNLLYLLPGAVGGTETYARGLLASLARLDEVSPYWLYVNTEAGASELPRGRDWHVVTCPAHASVRALRYAWEQFVLPRQAKASRLDVLHSLGYVQPTRLRCKSVVTIHDLNFHNLGHLMSRTRRAALRYFVTRSARSADHILTVSEFSKRQIVDVLGVPPEKVTVTYNAVRGARGDRAESRELEAIYGVREPYLLGLSSQSPHKNIANLVKAFALLRRRGAKGLHLVLAGHRPDGSGELEQAIRGSGFASDIHCTGHVPENILNGLYANADAFVFPSIYEGFGIPVLEAFAQGTPVVCSRAAAIPEVAGEAASYFDPSDPGEMAEAIDAVVRNEAVRERLVSRGRSRLRLFTWEKAAETTLGVYRQVVEGDEGAEAGNLSAA